MEVLSAGPLVPVVRILSSSLQRGRGGGEAGLVAAAIWTRTTEPDTARLTTAIDEG